MTASCSEHSDQVRAALRAIVSDPEHGVDALCSARTMANLLHDLLPDAPRETGLLTAAAEKRVPATLREHVAQGMDVATAMRCPASGGCGSRWLRWSRWSQMA